MGSSSVQRLEGNVVEMEISVDAEEFDRAVDDGFRKLARQVNVPGFRKGKAPRVILEARFGRGPAVEDALDTLVSEAYSRALVANKLDPIDKPEIKVVQAEPGKTLVFKAKVDIVPDVRLPDLDSVRIQREAIQVSDEEVAERLEALRRARGRLVDVTDRDIIRDGDYVVCDYEARADGKPMFSGGKEGKFTDVVVHVETEVPAIGFEDRLVGVKVGEPCDIPVTYPADFDVEALAGKEVIFSVTPKAVKTLELPEVNDEFAAAVSEGKDKTVDELRGDIRARLVESAEARARTELEAKIVDAITEAAEVDVPDKLVARRVRDMVEDIDEKARRSGSTLEAYLEKTGLERARLEEDLRPGARENVKRELVMGAVAKAHGIAPERGDVEQRVEALASSTGRDASDVRSFLESTGRIHSIEDAVVIRKTLDLLVARCERKGDGDR